MNVVDTNVLIYVHDPRNPAKQQIAAALIDKLQDGALVWQVACEYLAASRKLKSLGLSYDHAVDRVQSLRAGWTTILPTWNVMDRMGTVRSRYNLSFWDGLLVATCLEAGVRRLYTEDFDAYSKIDSLEIVNPFRGLE